MRSEWANEACKPLVGGLPIGNMQGTWKVAGPQGKALNECRVGTGSKARATANGVLGANCNTSCFLTPAAGDGFLAAASMPLSFQMR